MMAAAFATIQVFSTVGSTLAGINVEALLVGYVLALVALVVYPLPVIHRVALPLSVLATWGRAEGFADLAAGGASNVWGTSVLFAAVGVFMVVWHMEGSHESEEAT